MLFGVKYNAVEIGKLQTALNYFFLQLENGNIIFDENLFPVDFRSLLYVRGRQANGYKVFVTQYIEPIFTAFLALNPADKIIVINAFRDSNKIEEICSIDATPVHFSGLPLAFRPSTRGFLNLYNDLANIIKRQVDINEFKILNGKICSICGSNTVSHLDHFLPKGTTNLIYILSAVNPRNLISLCTECNLGKSSRLIIFDNDKLSGQRVKVFSPYENFETWELLNIKLKCSKSPTGLDSGEWQVNISLNKRITELLKNKINRWKNFYKIEKRFANELKTNINIWIKSFEHAKDQKNATLQSHIDSITPTKLSLIQTPNILLQSQFFIYLNQNTKLKNIFLPAMAASQNPNDLLVQIGIA